MKLIFKNQDTLILLIVLTQWVKLRVHNLKSMELGILLRKVT